MLAMLIGLAERWMSMESLVPRKGIVLRKTLTPKEDIVLEGTLATMIVAMPKLRLDST